jgi:multimeric flavodoxin WrbA
MKILAIVGSGRTDGNTNYLVDQALKEAGSQGAETEKIILSDYTIKPCLGHENCGTFPACVQNDDMRWILDKLCAADGIILATPVYVWNISGQMKTFIDRNYFIYKKGKKVPAKAVGMIIVAGGDGIEESLQALESYLGGSYSVDRSRWFAVGGYAGGKGAVKNNAALVEKARKLGRDMVESLKKDQVK